MDLTAYLVSLGLDCGTAALVGLLATISAPLLVGVALVAFKERQRALSERSRPARRPAVPPASNPEQLVRCGSRLPKGNKKIVLSRSFR